ncbi:MAG TPA: molybdopterin-dependent oxidoreductase [Methylomirabilota bacterium]
MVALTDALGSGAMTNSMDDIVAEARAVFVIGSNTTEQHPVFGMRLRAAARQRGLPIIVADLRRIPLAEVATLHLPLRPGTDIALLNALAHVLVTNGWVDREFVARHTEGIAAFEDSVRGATPEWAAGVTGVPAGDIRRTAGLLWRHRPGALLFAMGITQHTCGTAKAYACTNLQLLLGNLGLPGSGINPTKTALTVKRLDPPYRLVLTGTPMENRLDELASIVEWVDDLALEPKWRLAPWHTTPVDGKTEVGGARNLDTLRTRLAGCMVRRVRAEVLSQLPARTDTRVPVGSGVFRRDMRRASPGVSGPTTLHVEHILKEARLRTPATAAQDVAGSTSSTSTQAGDVPRRRRSTLPCEWSIRTRHSRVPPAASTRSRGLPVKLPPSQTTR